MDLSPQEQGSFQHLRLSWLGCRSDVGQTGPKRLSFLLLNTEPIELSSTPQTDGHTQEWEGEKRSEVVKEEFSSDLQDK